MTLADACMQADCESEFWSFLQGQDDLTAAYDALRQVRPAISVLLPPCGNSTLFLGSNAAFRKGVPDSSLAGGELASFLLFNSLPLPRAPSELLENEVQATSLAHVMNNDTYSLAFAKADTKVWMT